MKTKSQPAPTSRPRRASKPRASRKIVPFQAPPAEVGTAAPTAPPPPVEQVVVESLALPVAILQAAAALAAQADDSRHILRNLWIHATDPGTVHVAATTGRQFFVARVAIGEPLPSWVNPGLLLSVEGLEARLKFLATGGDFVTIRHIASTTSALIVSADEEITLRQAIGDGSFPAYDQLTTAASFSEEEVAPEFSACPLSTDNLKLISKLGAFLSTRDKNKPSVVRQFRGATKANIVIDFPDTPGAMLIVSPFIGDTMIPEATAALMGPAITATVAALKAHQTRAKKAGDKAKAADYAARIKSILERTSKPALPAPGPDAEAEPAGEPAAE